MKDFYLLQPFHVYGPIYTDIETIAKRFIFKNLKGKDSDLKLKYIYFGQVIVSGQREYRQGRGKCIYGQ